MNDEQWRKYCEHLADKMQAEANEIVRQVVAYLRAQG